MAMEIPVDNLPKNANSPCAGRAHCILVGVDEDGGRNGEMIATFEVIEHAVPGQYSTMHEEWFTKSVKAGWRFHELAMALGVVTQEQLKDAKEKGQSVAYDFPAYVGRHLHVNFEDHEYNGKTNIRAKSFHRIDDPRCASWPKHRVMLQRAGIAVPDAPAASAGVTPTGGSLGSKLKGL